MRLFWSVMHILSHDRQESKPHSTWVPIHPRFRQFQSEGMHRIINLNGYLLSLSRGRRVRNVIHICLRFWMDLNNVWSLYCNPNKWYGRRCSTILPLIVMCYHNHRVVIFRTRIFLKGIDYDMSTPIYSLHLNELSLRSSIMVDWFCMPWHTSQSQ